VAGELNLWKTQLVDINAVDPGRALVVMVAASESLTAGEGQTVVARTSEDVVAASRMTPSHPVEARHQPRRHPVTRRASRLLEASRRQRRIHATIRVSLAAGASPVMQADHAQSQVHLLEVARLQKTRTKMDHPRQERIRMEMTKQRRTDVLTEEKHLLTIFLLKV